MPEVLALLLAYDGLSLRPCRQGALDTAEILAAAERASEAGDRQGLALSRALLRLSKVQRWRLKKHLTVKTFLS